MTIWTLVKTGGWVIYPLVIFSVIAWAVCLERFVTLRNWKEKNREFLLSFQNHWLRNDRQAAKQLCENTHVDLAELARELLVTDEKAGTINDRVLAKLDRRRQEQSVELKKNIWILGTIGAATPFVGLFGTVVGIIKAFQNMAESGAGGYNVVASGISEALVATAGGILVAVVAILFYNYFLVKVNQLQFQLKILSEELLDIFES